MRGKRSDILARLQHETRCLCPDSVEYQARLFAEVYVDGGAVLKQHAFNLRRPWYLRNGKRPGLRRRHTPYWGASSKPAVGATGE